MTLDPLAALTRAPYLYAGDDPANGVDRTGEAFESAAGDCAFCIPIPSPSAAELESAGSAIAKIGGEIGSEEGSSASAFWNWITGQDESSEDEAEAEAAEETPCAEVDTTPAGTPYSEHYLDDKGPERNIPGSVVDETIEHGELVADEGGRSVYYDPKNDTTVVVDDGEVLSARRGIPRSGQR